MSIINCATDLAKQHCNPQELVASFVKQLLCAGKSAGGSGGAGNRKPSPLPPPPLPSPDSSDSDSDGDGDVESSAEEVVSPPVGRDGKGGNSKRDHKRHPKPPSSEKDAGGNKRDGAVLPPLPPPPPPPPAWKCNEKLRCRELLNFFAEDKIECYTNLFLELPADPNCCVIPNRLFQAVQNARHKAESFFKRRCIPDFTPCKIHAVYLNPRINFTYVDSTVNGRTGQNCCGKVHWAGYFYADFEHKVSFMYGYWLIDNVCFPCDPCKPMPCLPRRECCDSGDAEGQDTEEDEFLPDAAAAAECCQPPPKHPKCGGKPKPKPTPCPKPDKCKERLLLVYTTCPFWRVPFLDEKTVEEDNCLGVNISFVTKDCGTGKKGKIVVNMSFTRKCGAKKITVKLLGTGDIPGRKRLVCAECHD